MKWRPINIVTRTSGQQGSKGPLSSANTLRNVFFVAVLVLFSALIFVDVSYVFHPSLNMAEFRPKESVVNAVIAMVNFIINYLKALY